VRKKGRDQSRGKLYSLHTDKGKPNNGNGVTGSSGGGVRPPMRCYNCGEVGHRANEC